VRVQAQLGASTPTRDRLEALHVDSTRQHPRTRACAPPRDLLDERLGRGGEQLDGGQHRARGQARARVAHVGAVHGERSSARSHRERGPRRQAEVGVHHIEAIARIAPAQIPCGAQQRARAGRELIQLHVPVAETPQRVDLVAHESSPLGMGRVGEHVGQHERAHWR
jgi:hypothetical protein